MSRETTYAGMIGDWQRLLTTLEANSAEVPQLEPFRVKLVGMVTQALDVTHQQADLKASKQAASKQMRQIATDAQRLATAVRPETVRRSPGTTTVRGGEPPKAGMLPLPLPRAVAARDGPPRAEIGRRGPRRTAVRAGGSSYAAADRRSGKPAAAQYGGPSYADMTHRKQRQRTARPAGSPRTASGHIEAPQASS